MGEKMGSKQYAKYDRLFMAFGSIMNGLQGQLTTENWEPIADKVWSWVEKRVSKYVDTLYAENEGKERSL